MRRIVAAFGLVCGLLASASAAPAGAERSASDCVSFRKASESQGIAYDVENGCDIALACTLTWTVVCTDYDGNATSRSRSSKRFRLEPNGARTVFSSAQSCKQGWRLRAVGWRCDPAR